ncbi:MAG: signal peptidase I [Candidatus Pacebacteria bacterium]|nr:signal peptidase I [Candidatus Paceibacterota bacterium]
MEKKFFKEFLDLVKIVLISLAIVIPIRAFIFQPFMVKGASMEPNYHSTDYLIIDQVSYRLNQPQRGDVIVFKYPKDPSYKYIKRIIAFPGEAVEIKDTEVLITDTTGKTFKLDESYLPQDLKDHWKNNINHTPVLLNKGEYFVLGDNRNYSSDSRVWGVVPEKNIVGKVFFTFSISNVLNGAKVNNNLIY